MADFKHANDLHDPLSQQKPKYVAPTPEQLGVKKTPEPPRGTLANMTQEKIGGLGKQLPERIGGLGHTKSAAMDNQTIPRPDITTLAKKYDQDALGLVNAVVMHYQEQIKRNGKLSKHLNMASTLKVLLKVHFGLLVRVIPYGASFKLELIDSSRALRPGGKVLAKAIVLAGQQRGQLLAKTYAGNKHQGNSHKHGSVKEVMKDKGADAFIQKKSAPKVLDGWRLDGDSPESITKGTKGNPDLAINIKEIMPALGATFGDSKLTIEATRKFCRQIDRILKTKKQIEAHLFAERFFKSLKHVKTYLYKAEQLGKNTRELALGTYHKMNQYLQEDVGKFVTRLADHANAKDKQEMTQMLNQALGKYGLPTIDNSLYRQKTTLAINPENGKTITKYKPKYKPSKKYPGYYIDQDSFGKYADENSQFTMFWKIGTNGQMIQIGQLNQK